MVRAGRGAYFEGWYLKHQGPEGELALIPAIHQRRGGERSATIQVITADQTRIFSFPRTGVSGMGGPV